jgi:hypothetical protein
MTYTVRIYTNAELTAYTDADYETIEQAYATLWQNPAPLPTDGTAAPTGGHEFGYGLWDNSAGVCVNSWPNANICGLTKEAQPNPVYTV